MPDSPCGKSGVRCSRRVRRLLVDDLRRHGHFRRWRLGSRRDHLRRRLGSRGRGRGRCGVRHDGRGRCGGRNGVAVQHSLADALDRDSDVQHLHRLEGHGCEGELDVRVFERRRADESSDPNPPRDRPVADHDVVCPALVRGPGDLAGRPPGRQHDALRRGAGAIADVGGSDLGGGGGFVTLRAVAASEEGKNHEGKHDRDSVSGPFALRFTKSGWILLDETTRNSSTNERKGQYLWNKKITPDCSGVIFGLI